MNTSDLVKYLSNNQAEDDAEDLLYCLNINAEKRFKKACKALEDLLIDIKITYPDARIIADDNTLKIFLGDNYTMPERKFNCTLGYATHNNILIAEEYFIKSLFREKDF